MSSVIYDTLHIIIVYSTLFKIPAKVTLLTPSESVVNFSTHISERLDTQYYCILYHVYYTVVERVQNRISD